MKNVSNFPSAPLVSLAAHLAAQAPIDTSKGAPAATPAQAAKTASKASSKPSAVKAKQYKDIEFNVRGSGAAKLFAHTAAWLELSGLIHGGKAPVELIEALGGSALRYHTKQGNMAQSQGMVSLTDKGMNKFKARESGGHGAYAEEDKQHYALMMMSGEHDDRLVRYAGNIKQLGK
jgi:ribosomal protein S11